MPRISRGVIRLLAVVAFVVVMQPLLQTISLADTTREFALCILSCNDGYDTCGDRCQVDCRALYASGDPALNVCISDCKALCNVIKIACKERCQAIKNGECPPEP